jgi:tetratricopeptide (TPR) repeat protein
MEIPLKGKIKDFSIPRILLYLNRNRKTGTLIIKTQAFTKKVYLDKGDAVFASSTREDDRLGEMLIKAGKITIHQLQESVNLLKTKKKRQGAILVELGYLTPKDLFWGVKYQVKEIICSLFILDDAEAEYEFVEGEIPANEVITLKMSMGNLIYEGAKKIDSLDRIMKEMDISSILKLSTDPISLYQNIELTDQDKKLLFRIDGRKTIKELADSSPTGSFEALKTIYALWSTGTLEEKETVIEKIEEAVPLDEVLKPFLEEEEAFIKRVNEMYSNLDSLSAGKLLEIDENSDSETIKRNYYRLIKEFHPDRYLTSADSSIKDKLIAIFDAITRSYTLLEDDEARREYFRPERKVEEEEEKEKENLIKKAEDQYQRGVEEFRKGNYSGAVEAFHQATKFDPNKTRYWSYLSLSLSKIPNGLNDAEDALLQAIKLEPNNVEHYVNLGQIYIKAGMKEDAYNQFVKALEINPENIKAQKGLTLTKP